MKKILLSLFTFIVFLNSCKKKSDDVSSQGIKIGPVDSFQIFYDFEAEDNSKILLSSKNGDSNFQDSLSLIGGDYLNQTGQTKTYTKKLPETNDKNKGWDILFTKYIDLYEYRGKDYGYIMTGILINTQDSVKVLKFENDNYNSINLSDVEKMKFSGDIDAIGADWKTYTNNEYSLVPNRYYIIKTKEGNYYKFRIVNYFTESTKSLLTIEHEKL